MKWLSNNNDALMSLGFSGLLLLSLLSLPALMYQYVLSNYNNKLLEQIIQIYGAFVATMLGVYFSLYFSRWQESEKTKKNEEQAMLGSLKIIWSELDINEDIFNNLKSGLEDMPKISTNLYTQQSYLIKYCSGLKSKAFYATMSSGTINIIANHQNIFNALQQAYYNIELTQSGLDLTNEIYRDLADKEFAAQNPDIVRNAFDMLTKEIKKVKRTIQMISEAKKITFDYLVSKGVTFTREEKLE